MDPAYDGSYRRHKQTQCSALSLFAGNKFERTEFVIIISPGYAMRSCANGRAFNERPDGSWGTALSHFGFRNSHGASSLHI